MITQNRIIEISNKKNKHDSEIDINNITLTKLLENDCLTNYLILNEIKRKMGIEDIEL